MHLHTILSKAFHKQCKRCRKLLILHKQLGIGDLASDSCIVAASRSKWCNSRQNSKQFLAKGFHWSRNVGWPFRSRFATLAVRNPAALSWKQNRGSIYGIGWCWLWWPQGDEFGAVYPAIPNACKKNVFEPLDRYYSNHDSSRPKHSHALHLGTSNWAANRVTVREIVELSLTPRNLRH